LPMKCIMEPPMSLSSTKFVLSALENRPNDDDELTTNRLIAHHKEDLA
jgi:hypothetical protein